jgi:hypothetical protein
MSWLDGQVFTNPAASTVLLDTGPMIPEGDQQLPTILISSTVAAVVLLQHRNAADGATLHQHALVVGANETLSLPSLGSVNAVETGQRLRCVLFTAVVGRIQVSFLT